jgi:multidrug efflux system outer membrane protein
LIFLPKKERIMRPIKSRVFPAMSLLCLMLGACSLSPNYQRPDLPVPATWPTHTPNPKGGEDKIDAQNWMAVYPDPTLQSLIQTALKNNRDLRVATLNIENARALYRVQRAATLPNFSLVAEDKISDAKQGANLQEYGVGISLLSYELDFFGKVANLKEDALYRFLATEAAKKNVQTALMADVAGAYLTWLADEALADLARLTVNAYEASHLTIKKRHAAGVVSGLELNQSLGLWSAAQADLAKLENAIAVDKTTLGVLLGEPFNPEKPVTATALRQLLVRDVPVNLPSDVLWSRPDIMAAEFQLKAANANIGVARAMRFPSVTLTGLLGSQSTELGNLWSQGAWIFTPQVTLPIFDMGRISANIDSAETLRDIAVANYDLAIQKAFKEVSDGLSSQAALTRQLAAMQTLLDSSRKSERIAQARYKEGLDNYLVLLDSQRARYQAEQSWVLTQLGELTNRVRLYKALGGGLNQTAPSAP